MVNRFIIDSHLRPSSPFFTHIFPKRIYKNFDRFAGEHFLSHGSGGAGDREAIALPDRRVCVTKHGKNISLIKRDQKWTAWPAEEIAVKACAKYPNLHLIFNKAEMIKILSGFGVPKERIE